MEKEYSSDKKNELKAANEQVMNILKQLKDNSIKFNDNQFILIIVNTITLAFSSKLADLIAKTKGPNHFANCMELAYKKIFKAINELEIE
ncbi:hypothetical protein KAJ61_05460 [Candidatus Parcubacteria bacterium]|nr:hypothetical protein [Candidatus Parcubacteria bacterium]